MPRVEAPQSDQAASVRFAGPRAVLRQAVAEDAFPGAAWGVLHHGEILAMAGEGRFTYEANSPAVQPDTVFDLASVSKVVATTAAAMLLLDRGSLHLDMRLGDILPGFVVGSDPSSGKVQVTLRMLLAHSAGLPGYVELFRTCSTPEALIRAALQLPLENPPGQRTVYSDVGYILLGKVMEVLSGEPLDSFCVREIFRPLGLAATTFNPPPEQRPRIAPTEEDTRFRNRVIQGEVQDENAWVLGGAAGHAGVFSSVHDLLCFAQCILSEGRAADGHQLFQPQTVRAFAAPQSTGRALGWDVPTPPSSSGRYFGPRSIGHLGYAGTSLWIDPDQELAVALLTNRTWPDRSRDTIRQVRPAFHDAVAEALR